MSISANFPNVQPSLLLDFANAKQLPPSVNFTRATTATYYDGHTTAKAEQNFVLYSQNFSDSNWVANSATKTSTTATDPAGGSTALTLTKTGTSDYSLRQTGIAPSANKTYTVSCYLKGTAGDTVNLYMDNGVDQTVVSQSVTLTASWVRYTGTGTFNSTSANVTCGVNFGSGTTATSVDVAFFQVEERSSATAYTATTTQKITNYIPVLLTAGGGQPRFDHNPTTSESLGLLIEEQRTNLLPYSSAFGSWSVGRCTLTANIGIAPDGTQTADSLCDEAGSGQQLYVQQSPVISASTAYVFSVYLKYLGRQWARLTRYDRTGAGGYPTTYFDLINGVVGNTSSGGSGGTQTGSITSVGNGWYRCQIAFTSDSTGGATGVYIEGAGGNSVPSYTPTTNVLGYLAWGAQLEAGSFATSYIPTTSASATRAADVVSMSGANFTSWFNAGEGTFYGEANLSGGGRYFHTVKTGSSAQIEGVQQITYFEAFVYTTDVQAQINIGGSSFISRRVALAYQVNDIAACVSGGAVSVDTNAILPLDLNAFYVNSYGTSGPLGSGTVKKVAYYPQRLTDAQLQALTS